MPQVKTKNNNNSVINGPIIHEFLTFLNFCSIGRTIELTRAKVGLMGTTNFSPQTALFSLGLSHGSASYWCALQEALYKCIDTIHNNAT